MKKIVISLGGSLIVPDDIDIGFLNQFVETIFSFSDQYVFGIICGGGKRAKRYMDRAKSNGTTKNEELDWLGIKATKENAELVCGMFAPRAYGVIDDPSAPIKTNKHIIIGAGYRPGFSTDMDAVLLAENIGAEMIINMSNIDYVYDKDPRTNEDAEKIEKISWEEFRKIVGDEWKPRLNAPFDPIASKKAQELGLKVVVISKDLDNLKKLLEEEEFEGTVINNT